MVFAFVNPLLYFSSMIIPGVRKNDDKIGELNQRLLLITFQLFIKMIEDMDGFIIDTLKFVELFEHLPIRFLLV